jgi:hypothetical protein
MMRATVSTVPPGGKPTNIRMGRSGKDCAQAGMVVAVTPAAAISPKPRLVNMCEPSVPSPYPVCSAENTAPFRAKHRAPESTKDANSSVQGVNHSAGYYDQSEWKSVVVSFLGAFTMYLRTSRRRWSVLSVLGCCLGVYVVFAAAFHWFVEPTVGKSYAAYAPPAYRPPTAAVRGPSAAVPRAAAVAPAVAVAPESRVSAAFAAVADVAQSTPEEKTTDMATKDAPKKHAAHSRHERSARHARNPWDFAATLFSGSRRWF